MSIQSLGFMNRIWIALQIVLVLIGIVLSAPSVALAAPLTLGVPGAGSAPGFDPLLEKNSWFVFQGETASTTITLTSGTLGATGTGQFAGFVEVAAQCCIDASNGKTVSLDLDVAFTATTPGAAAPLTSSPLPSGLHVNQGAGACKVEAGKGLVCPHVLKTGQRVVISGGGTVSFNLSVMTRGSLAPGRYLVTITAVSTDPSGIIANNAWATLNVLPALPVDDAEMPSACPVSSSPGGQVTGEFDGHENPAPPMEVLLLRPLIRQLFALKALAPSLTSFVAPPITTLSGSAGWLMTISAPPTPLPPNMTMITVVDTAGWDKIISGFNSSICPHTVIPVMPVPTGGSTTITLDLTQARTLLLRRQACANWVGLICGDTDRFEDIAIFSETNFAFLFGGRAVTLNWFFSQGE